MKQLAVNRDLWKRKFQSFPSWLCPTCQEGTLGSDKDAETIKETGPSKRARGNEDWTKEWIDERFSAFLKCQNNICGEIVVVSGNLEHLHDFYHDEFGVINDDFVSYVVPKSLIPAPPLFPLHVVYPDELKQELSQAFSLIWPDQTACANRLRVCVELFLDERIVPKAHTLHQRIESIKVTKPNTYEMLLAIKWIGNAGSHSDLKGLSRTDLLDAFDIFAFVLEETYLERKDRLQEIAAKINAANIKHP